MSQTKRVSIETNQATLTGDLILPRRAKGLIVFVHGSGSNHLSPRNRFVAQKLNDVGLGSLLFNLLTPTEARLEQCDGHFSFNIDLLTTRLNDVVNWIHRQPNLHKLPVGYFGASTGAAAALVEAAHNPKHTQAVVSRGGRPDLAMPFLHLVKVPTLLIVGELDTPTLDINQDAYQRLNCEKKMDIVPQATHLFEEDGALASVSELAAQWFATHLSKH